MTHHHKIEDREYLLVGISEEASEIELQDVDGHQELFYFSNAEQTKCDRDWLPPGTWQLVGTSDALGEEQAQDLVKQCDKYYTPCFLNYETEDTYFDRPTDSLATLLTSLHITRCAILQRVR